MICNIKLQIELLLIIEQKSFMYLNNIHLKWVLLILVSLITSQAFGHGMSEAEKQLIIEGGNLRYIWIGATHMLSGYDHLLFVFGIVFFLTKFLDIVKYVTAFTIGHSITLIFATFNAIQINYFLIDAIIALSVCYIAFTNLEGFKKYLNINPPNMLVMISGLGLIHGLGLSTRLQQLPLNEDQLLLNIISFNAGIELGQIAALALMLGLIAAFRNSHYFKPFSLISNYVLILAGGFLFLMQMHDYSHSGTPEKITAASTNEDSSMNMDHIEGLSDLELEITDETTNKTIRKDTITVTIPARGEKEYKLLVQKGDTFEYFWQSDSEPLFYDFHAEPAAGTAGYKAGYFESYQKSTQSAASGNLTSKFTGPHGWYWKNNSRSAVNITLEVKGEYLLP